MSESVRVVVGKWVVEDGGARIRVSGRIRTPVEAFVVSACVPASGALFDTPLYCCYGEKCR